MLNLETQWMGVIITTIKHHLEKDMSRIVKHIYADNLITGVESEDETYQLYIMSKETFKEISMNLREWKSSSTKVKKVFKEDELKESQFKALGLNWNSVKDKMTIRTDSFENMEPAI